MMFLVRFAAAFEIFLALNCLHIFICANIQQISTKIWYKNKYLPQYALSTFGIPCLFKKNIKMLLHYTLSWANNYMQHLLNFI